MMSGEALGVDRQARKFAGARSIKDSACARAGQGISVSLTWFAPRVKGPTCLSSVGKTDALLVRTSTYWLAMNCVGAAAFEQ